MSGRRSAKRKSGRRLGRHSSRSPMNSKSPRAGAAASARSSRPRRRALHRARVNLGDTFWGQVPGPPGQLGSVHATLVIAREPLQLLGEAPCRARARAAAGQGEFSMVRRGSTVRVRQRASLKCLQTGPLPCRACKRLSRAGTRGHSLAFPCRRIEGIVWLVQGGRRRSDPLSNEEGRSV